MRDEEATVIHTYSYPPMRHQHLVCRQATHFKAKKNPSMIGTKISHLKNCTFKMAQLRGLGVYRISAVWQQCGF